MAAGDAGTFSLPARTDGGPAEPARMAVAFAHLLRAAGVEVPVGAVLTYVDALGAVGLERQAGVYWAGRATLLRRPEDAAAYDRVFHAFWRGREPVARSRPVPEEVTLALDDDERDSEAAEDEEEQAAPGRVLSVRYSAAEVLRHRDFGDYSDADFDEARRAMAALRFAGSMRRSRRQTAVRRGGTPDLRRSVRRALRAGGEPVARAWRGPSERPRRIVFVCDVSGSMESYSRALLRFLHAAVIGRGRVEAFALGTRLTRLTRELSSHDPDAALRAAAAAVADWSGGTRLGAGIGAFNDEWGVRGMARGAVVVVLSDGWDRGDPDVLALQMARLHRVAHRVVWVNPLKASPGYAPLARGMAAALPYVDDFVEGHSLASLEALVEVVSR